MFCTVCLARLWPWLCINTGAAIRPIVNSNDSAALADAASLDSTGRTNDDVNAALAASYSDRPLSVIVRYARGCEDQAKALEARLVAKGLTVKYRQRGESAECAHEQIVESSYRADDDMAARLKGAVSELDPFAISLNLDPRASSDFVVILSPNSKISPPEPTTEISEAQNTATSTATTTSLLGKNQATTLNR